jgi:hypothetical protein
MKLLRSFWDIFKKLEEDEIFSYDYRDLMKLVNYNIKGNERGNFINNMVRQDSATKWKTLDSYVTMLKKNIDDERYWQ